MKKSKVTRSLLAACSIVALSAVMYGCVHSGDGPTYSQLDLMGGHNTAAGATVTAGSYGIDGLPDDLASALEGYTGPTTAGAGEALTIGGYTFTCGDDSSCSVTVAEDESHFTTTGTITVALIPPPPPDRDGDGVADADDAFPDDPDETADADGDGIGDNADAHNVLNDRDNDGVADSGDDFPDDPNETRDSDDDGVGDNADVFPLDAAETMDTDGDGVGDNADAFPTDPTETADSDDDGVGDNAQAIAEANAKVETKAAGTKLKAINAEAAQTTDAGLGGTGVTTYTESIKRDRDGTEVKVTDSNLAAKADPKFVDQMAGLDAGRFMLVRTKDADDDGNVEEEVVVIGTDIKAPRVVAFAKVDGQALNARDLDTGKDADGDGTPNNDFTALTVATTDAVLALVKSPAFPLTGTAVLTFDFDDTTTTGTDEADEVSGTYNGAMGTYRCNGSAVCTVTIGVPSGETERAITAMTGDWVFTPNAGVTSDVPDAAYLHYGFWLKKTTDEDGVLEYNEVETFAGASIDPSGDVTSVLGTASYDGDAVGVYVHHELSEGGGKIESSTAGHFKADASLMATFGQVPVSATDSTGTIAPNLVNTVTGTIDNFVLSGGEEQDWEVSLSADITESAGATADGGTAKGGVPNSDGSFSATFHGDVTAVGGVVPKPSDVVGEFNADFRNGAVAGAFGATLQDE